MAFASIATKLVRSDTDGWRDVFLRDRRTGTTTLVSVSTAGELGDRASADPRISADGRFMAFRSAARNLIPNDTNRATDVFVRGPFR